ncbi:MAG: hypothetical protein Q9201_007129 [Fulgogasparrea decipioides]
MASHRSDSSDEDDGQYTTTDVMLGYASQEPTDDTFSQLGGTPTWLGNEPPSSLLAKCRTCNSLMALLLQLNGDLPEHFPGHERRLYVFACRNKPCRRKPGTIRAIRGIKISQPTTKGSTQPGQTSPETADRKATRPPINLGDSIFMSQSTGQANSTLSNPLSTSSHPTPNANPFSSTKAANPIPYGHQKHNLHSLSASVPQNPPPSATANTAFALSQTFAQKARISSPEPSGPMTREPWPSPSSLPKPYSSYHLDADYETFDAPSQPDVTTSSSLVQATSSNDKEAPATNEDDDPTSWLSASAKADTTFLRFAARLAQNPEQVLRYEFRGQPLLYSKHDDVGQAFSSTPTPHRVPACSNCGGKKVFEFQLTPHAISQLEAEEMGLEGMEWGTVVVGVCERDCVERGVPEGKVGWVEEWVGVSWEESVKR